MSDRDLQRVTKCVSDIGQASTRGPRPNRRNHITQKVRIAGQHMLYLSVHEDAQLAEIFLRVKGADSSSELIGLYAVIARPMSLTLQYDAPLEKVVDLIAAANCVPCAPVTEDARSFHLLEAA